MFMANLFKYEGSDRLLTVAVVQTYEGSAAVDALYAVTVTLHDTSDPEGNEYTAHSIENLKGEDLANITVIGSMAVSLLSMLEKWLMKFDAADLWMFAEDVVEDDIFVACEDWRISFSEMRPGLQPSLDGLQDYLLGNMLIGGDFPDWLRTDVSRLLGIPDADLAA